MSTADKKRNAKKVNGLPRRPLMARIFDAVEEDRAKPNGRTPFDIRVEKDITYKTEGGQEMRLDVYYPPFEVERAPLVLDIPGGGWMIHNRRRRDGYAKCFAQMGAVVAVIDHRLCPEIFFPDNLKDCVDAYNFLVGSCERFHLDPNNVVVTGDSSGGHLGACLCALATHPTFAEQLGVKRPLTKPVGAIFVSGAFSVKVMHRIPLTHTLMVRYMSGQRTRTAYKNWEYSKYLEPYDFITKDFPPCYNNGGMTDLLCFNEAKRMAGKLTAAGVKNEYAVGKNLFNSAHCYMLRFPFAPARRDALKLYKWYAALEADMGADIRINDVEYFFTNYKKALKGTKR